MFPSFVCLAPHPLRPYRHPDRAAAARARPADFARSLARGDLLALITLPRSHAQRAFAPHGTLRAPIIVDASPRRDRSSSKGK